MPTLAWNLGETPLVPVDGADAPFQLLEKRAKTIFLEGACEAFLCVVAFGGAGS